MHTDNKHHKHASEKQLAYAHTLDYGMKAGFLILVFSFILYVSGLIKPLIPLNDLPLYWEMSAKEYVQAANIPTGWGWISLIKYGDFANFIGMAFLASVTIFCFVRILPILARKNDIPYLSIAILEIMVLIAAASGIITAGH